MKAQRHVRATRAIVTVMAGVVLAGSLGGALSSPAAAALGSSALVVDPNESVAYQQDPAHDGHSTDPSFVAPLTQAWSATFEGPVGSPLIVDGRLFVTVGHASGSGTDVEALSLATGDVLWGPVPVSSTSSTSSITYDSGRVFMEAMGGHVTAFDAATGALDWDHQLAQWSFLAPPTAVNGTLYVGGDGFGATLYAIDEATGITQWSAAVDTADHSSPAVDDSGVYLTSGCQQAYRFTLDGTQVWYHNPGCTSGLGKTAVLHDGRLYAREDFARGPGQVLDTATGDQVASYAATQAPAFAGQHMAAVSGGVLTVSDTADGHPIWRTTTDNNVTAPLIANGYVVEGRADGTVEARYVQNGELAWRGQAGAELTEPDEWNVRMPTWLAEGDGALVVPAANTLTVFAPTATQMSITSGPAAGSVTGSTASFSFSSAAIDPQYVCTLDDISAPCTSPMTYPNLNAGRHDFQVAVDDAAVGEATRTFVVDAAGPSVDLAGFPSRVIRQATATARWSAADNLSGVAAYQVRVRQSRDGDPYSAWSVRLSTTATSETVHVARGAKKCVSVRAEDGVRNWSAWSAARCVRRPR